MTMGPLLKRQVHYSPNTYQIELNCLTNCPSYAGTHSQQRIRQNSNFQKGSKKNKNIQKTKNSQTNKQKRNFCYKTRRKGENPNVKLTQKKQGQKKKKKQNKKKYKTKKKQKNKK